MIEYICRLVIEQGHQVAQQIAIKAQYAPREPNKRALFYFLTEQWDKYESLDYEHTLLQKVYELGDEKLRKQIADKARQAGRIAWVQIVAGGRKGQRLGEMTDAEWETTLNVLNSGEQWEEMWRLAQNAPAIWSKQLLQKLKQVAWIPKVEEERKGFERLRQLADKCLEKTMPMGKLTFCQATLTGHTKEVWGISFSSDGQLLASCSWDETMLWSQLSHLPIEQIYQQNREWIQKALQDNKITKEERLWLEFMQALMDWHGRFDVEVEDAPQLVSTGEFDIEIEG